MLKRIVTLVLVAGVAACATSPTGRKQLQLFPESQMRQMGLEAYSQMKKETPAVKDKAITGYVDCVAHAITATLDSRSGGDGWEVTVFRDDAVNAFALPGGKIGVYTGLLPVAKTPDQLATVIGHEVAHVLANHANARMSTQYATSAGLSLIEALAGGSSQEKQQTLALLGLGAQIGVILPFTRSQESEADLLGLDLMARAGFDPRQSVKLWQNMSKAGGGAPPEFLSTHPSHSTRIHDLEKRMPRAMNIYERARSEGRDPQCKRPASIDGKG
ncbi:MAG: M48 family metallopeptidase [Ectothiorhodospiraceae bacterium]|jgi:predicted Zn-dependent protease